MPDLPTACVIGAGSSGITALKGLRDRGIRVTCFDKSDRVGGNWVFGNKNKMSSAYKTLHINTSRDRMQYADYPMPRSYPDFPHHTQIAAYFDDYVRHFDLGRDIELETGVKHAAREPDGAWRVELDTGETRIFDALCVANGHHWDPQWPDPPFPGRFDGVELHSHHYTDPEMFRDKSVVVLGMGNSAMDIAVDASTVARRTFLAARRGAWIIPKYLFGRPLDQFIATPKVPWAVRRGIYERLVRLAVGDMERYGLPTPDHRLGEAHPTISGRILDRITHGAVVPKPNIAALEGDSVRFSDGTVERADVVVYCTGYRVTFPFFDPDLVSARDNDLPLFRRVFHTDIAGLFFVGLLQPLGAIMPLAEAQGRWIARYLTGEYALPPRDEMLADVERERAAMFARYVRSRRHTMQVDFDDYLADLEREVKRGAKRAKRLGHALPIAPVAERHGTRASSDAAVRS